MPKSGGNSDKFEAIYRVIAEDKEILIHIFVYISLYSVLGCKSNVLEGSCPGIIPY